MKKKLFINTSAVCFYPKQVPEGTRLGNTMGFGREVGRENDGGRPMHRPDGGFSFGREPGDADDRAEIVRRTRAVLAKLQENAADPANPPSLLVVTKTQPLSRVSALPRGEILGIGENRVQEIGKKIQENVETPPIHLIGRLQTNKVADIMDGVCGGRVVMVQSLDRMPLAQKLNRAARERGFVVPCLVQVNIGRESQKGGLPPEDTTAAVRAFAQLPGIRVEGLMAVLPAVDFSRDGELLRPMFRAMRTLWGQLRDMAAEGTEIKHLSMGMSQDAFMAAQEGATMVRVGSAIFGSRSG